MNNQLALVRSTEQSTSIERYNIYKKSVKKISGEVRNADVERKV